MDRTAWLELPAEARSAVETHTGSVEHARTAETGVMSRLACTLHTAAGPVFVKGTRSDEPASWMYDYETRVTRVAPLAPRVLWQVDAGGWLLTGYEHLIGAHPNLAPDSPDLGPFLDALTTMSESRWPEQVRKKPLCVRWAGFYPADRSPDLEGRTLVHSDVSPLNMLTGEDGIRVLDWALACPGPAWADTGFAVPRFIHAGHTVEEAEVLARSVSAYRTADPSAVTTFAHALCAVWESRDRSDPAPHRAPLIAAARAWAGQRVIATT
ncbi:phosphotransferase [Streptomyces sp. NBC_01317]|uniref:phosphotransferase n=1 Tax=Streptomyces sp. NBC_01317 TaxID=2903822 RepID=UPI002E117601|nr:phosphotransferase [Streptomyces sp. NBC_01317]